MSLCVTLSKQRASSPRVSGGAIQRWWCARQLLPRGPNCAHQRQPWRSGLPAATVKRLDTQYARDIQSAEHMDLLRFCWNFSPAWPTILGRMGTAKRNRSR